MINENEIREDASETPEGQGTSNLAEIQEKTKSPETRELLKAPESKNKPKKQMQWKKVFSLSNVCFAVAVLLITIGALVISTTIHKGGESAKEAYENAKNKAAEDAYNKFYDTAYASAEKKYHVSNHVSIEVAAVREEANLEVLKVSDVEYEIESKENNEDGIEVWMEFYGDGVYTVDMKASEFITDTDRQYVLVRVPRPELTECKITGANELNWKNGQFNKSVSKGTDLAVDMEKAGYAKLNNYMKSNAQFYKSAKSSAQTIITDLVKGINPDLPNLVVEVEFVD